ncbi:MAG: hypothetical protein IPL78_07715 [Chloroflexi bacterium]|nr:hypothetical protein [Chloroflexota bacterium]
MGQVGGERTRKILALRAAASGITPQIHDTLNELITLYSNDEEMRQGADMLQQLNQLLDTEARSQLSIQHSALALSTQHSALSTIFPGARLWTKLL